MKIIIDTPHTSLADKAQIFRASALRGPVAVKDILEKPTVLSPAEKKWNTA